MGSYLTEADDEEGKTVVTFSGKNASTVNFQFLNFFLSFSIQHSAVHQAWYTSHVGPLIKLPVTKGMEKQKKPTLKHLLIFSLSIYFPRKFQLFHNEMCCKFH